MILTEAQSSLVFLSQYRTRARASRGGSLRRYAFILYDIDLCMSFSTSYLTLYPTIQNLSLFPSKHLYHRQLRSKQKLHHLVVEADQVSSFNCISFNICLVNISISNNISFTILQFEALSEVVRREQPEEQH